MVAFGAFSQRGAPLGSSFGELLVEGHLDALDLVTQLDGGAQLQVHALLDGGQREQQQRLAVNVLHTGRQTAGEVGLGRSSGGSPAPWARWDSITLSCEITACFGIDRIPKSEV